MEGGDFAAATGAKGRGATSARKCSGAKCSGVPKGTRKRPNYARWRAISLSLVYILFGIHIAHWKLTGKTLAPLELNEVMYTLELGIVTAGFLFMCAVVLGTLIFGRFFCSWACHIMVLQDLCGWILRKLGITPRPIRLRLFLLVPPLTAFYMFLWPQFARAWHDQALPTFRFATDREGWASFVTGNFWRNLPDPWVIAITFLVCGFTMVYVLGSRTFCTYVCPYGAIFGLADRFAPGRILVSDACKQCGKCTATCTSGVRVHEEVNLHGMVVNPACMKDFDCISVCPQNALSYGFTKPALFRSYSSGGRFGLPYDFSWLEEIAAALVFAFTVLSLRGLYSRVPFLLSLALGVLMGFGCLTALRLRREGEVALSTVRLKSDARLTGSGRVFTALFYGMALLILHSGFVRFHEYTGLRQAMALGAIPEGADAKTDAEAVASSALSHLATADRWGLLRNERVERGASLAALRANRFDESIRYARRYLARRPGDLHARWTLAQAFSRKGLASEAESEFRAIVAGSAAAASQERDVLLAARQELATLCARRGDYESAVVHLQELIALDPAQARTHAGLGSALAELGRMEEAVAALREAVRLDDQLADATYNLGTLLAHMNRYAEAVPLYEKAAKSMSQDADLRNNLGFALLRLGRADDASQQLRDALALDPNHAGAHFNLGVLLASDSNVAEPAMREAEEHLRTAARLDPRYARALQGSADP